MVVAVETPIDLAALLIVKMPVLLENLSLKKIDALCLKILDIVGQRCQDFISTKKLPNVKNSFMVVAMEMPIDLEALLIVKRPALLENLSLK